MPKDKIKEVVGEYWKAFTETLIIGILLVAFSQASSFFFFIAILYSIVDLIVMVGTAIQGNPKFLVVELLVYLFKGVSKRGSMWGVKC